jgi:hypothetical protein
MELAFSVLVWCCAGNWWNVQHGTSSSVGAPFELACRLCVLWLVAMSLCSLGAGKH